MEVSSRNAVPTQSPELSDEAWDLAQSCVLHYPALLNITAGQSHPHIYLVKAMLQALSAQFPELRCTGTTPVLDDTTAQSLRLIQRCAGLPETGNLDKSTWNRLCRLYRAVFDRYHAPTQG